MSKIVVYTAITGGYGDHLRPPLVSKTDMRDVSFVCFSDFVQNPPTPWCLKRPVWQHASSARRTARYHKLNPHKLFPDAEYSIWLDGSEQLAWSPHKLIHTYLKSADFATFKHPLRRTVAAEVTACIRLKKDNPATLKKHLDRYRKAGFKDQGGVWETSIVIRRHTPQIARFNDLWWAEMIAGSLRDQVSLPYVVERTGTKICSITGSRGHCPYLIHKTHDR